MSATHHNLTTLSWFDSDCEVVISGTRPRELGPQGEPGEEGSNAYEREGKNRTEPAPGGLLRGSAASAGCGVHVLIVSVRRIGTWRVRSENWLDLGVCFVSPGTGTSIAFRAGSPEL